MGLSFPYVKEPVKTGYIYRPKIPAKFRNKDNNLIVVGTLDSGSDVTLIPRSHAEFLELDLSGKTFPIGGVGGGKLECVKSPVTIEVGGFLLLRKTVMVPLKGELYDVLFGRNPFFEEFDITFKENAKRVILNKIRR